MSDRCCAVCDRAIGDREGWNYHARLGAFICFDCPKTNVRGEDVTSHTMLFHWPMKETPSADSVEEPHPRSPSRRTAP